VNPEHPHALYRFFDHTGTLLYIGITWDIAVRFPQHTTRKPWWSTVANITIETHPNRPAVLEAERHAIQAEKPLYNVTHAAGVIAGAAVGLPTRNTYPDDPRWTDLATAVPELRLVREWIDNAAEEYLYLAIQYDNGRICGDDLWHARRAAAGLIGDMPISHLAAAMAGPSAGDKVWPDETDTDWTRTEPGPALSMSWEAPRDLHRNDPDARLVKRIIREGWQPPTLLKTSSAYDVVRDRFRGLMPACVGCSCPGGAAS
jgi:predicted GIY-YIG superfamily endonuclease